MGLLTPVSGQLGGSTKMKSVKIPKLTVHVPITLIAM